MWMISVHLKWTSNMTRGPKGHISCTWIQCATFLADWTGRPPCFCHWPKKKPEKYKLGWGHWDLGSCPQFRWIPFSGFRGEVKNVSANQRSGQPSCFANRPEKKYKLGTIRSTIRSRFLSSFVEFRSVVSEENSKMSQPIRGWGSHLVFTIGKNNPKIW